MLRIPELLVQLNRLEKGRILGTFRLFFGLCLVYEILYYLSIGLIDKGLRAPALLFPHDGFEFLSLLPSPWSELLLFVALISAIAISLGWKYRLAMPVFTLCFAYFFFIDKGLYNNHLYLFLLLCILLCFIPADGSPSVMKRRREVRRWMIVILQFQLLLVYFYGGLSKLNSEWLMYQQPVRELLRIKGTSSEFYTAFLTYGGLAFDLLIPFFLLWSRTRLGALVAVVFFNLTNSILFDDIGVFPFFMTGATLILFPAGRLKEYLEKSKSALRKSKSDSHSPGAEPLGAATAGLLGAWIVFQLLFPLRWLLSEAEPDWHARGFYYCWRMKSQSRSIEELNYEILDPVAKRINTFDPAQYLTVAQMNVLAIDPQMHFRLISHLSREARAQGIADPAIRARVRLRYNGRAGCWMFDPEKRLDPLVDSVPAYREMQKLPGRDFSD